MAIVTVETKGQVIGLNADLMLLLSNGSGDTLVRASRTGGTWTVHADGLDDVTVGADRNDAISAMTAHAQTVTGAENYTAQVQTGLRDQP